MVFVKLFKISSNNRNGKREDQDPSHGTHAAKQFAQTRDAGQCLGSSSQGGVLDKGVVSSNLVILHPLLHAILELVDVDRALLLAHMATHQQGHLLGDDVGKVNKRRSVSRVTYNTNL